MGKKLLVIEFNEQERFALWAHFNRNVVTQSAKEQDEFGQLWDDFQLDDIEGIINARIAAGDGNTGEKDFDGESLLSVELTKDEAGHFIAFCGRPMAGALSRLIRPLRTRVAEARDKAGLKPVKAELSSPTAES